MLDKANIRAVGFDVDGTLYDISEQMSIEVGTTVMAQAAAMLGRDSDDFEEEFLKKREELRGNTLTLNSFGLDGEQIFQRVIDEFPMEKYIKKDQSLINMIEHLKKSYELFIITNGAGHQVERKLKLIGLNKDDFAPRIYAYDQGWVKPEQAPFLAALEDLQIPAENCVYIGDREDIDIEGAKAVGMKSIYIRGKSDVADAYCDSVYDIESLLLKNTTNDFDR